MMRLSIDSELQKKLFFSILWRDIFVSKNHEHKVGTNKIIKYVLNNHLSNFLLIFESKLFFYKCKFFYFCSLYEFLLQNNQIFIIIS